MAQKIFIGKISKGLEQFYLPFTIDNDAFPTLFNAYAWRGRIKRKRGTTTLGRLQIQKQIVAFGATQANWQLASQVLGGSGNINLVSVFSLGTYASIVPGTINVTVNGTVYTDPAMNGTLSGGAGGTINYSTGAAVFTGQAGQTLYGTAGQVSFAYYPILPVMGLEDLLTSGSTIPTLMAFDTMFSYQITNNSFYDVSYYKGTSNPVVWSGQNYQQFWSTNYQGAFWATNNKPGFHFGTGTYVSGSTTTMIVITLSGGSPTLIVGDMLYFNEWGANTISGKTGRVTNVAAGPQYTVTFSSAVTASATGLVQFLTSSLAGQDGIKWYDGDQTGGTGIPTSASTGWVNFAPPLYSATGSTIVIGDLPNNQIYYLVGALAIVPFKDRLLFFSPWVQASSGSAFQIKDTLVWSWNGTPYYTDHPSALPANQTANNSAYFVDQTGFGGWLSSGLNQNIISVANNEDVLLVGFTGKQTRLVYTSNDVLPFLFHVINSELGASSTFSTVTLDKGALTFGSYGIALTTQVGSQRIDLQIPNQVFQLGASNNLNAALRLSAARDFFHEWIYFTYVPSNSLWAFPTQTLQYNYREESWAVLYENFTTQGLYRSQTGNTWANNPWNTSNTPWAGIQETWSAGLSQALFPSVVAGTPQGFVVNKGSGSGEAPTGAIAAIASSGGQTQITSSNHCVSSTGGPLSEGDYLYFTGCIGSTFLNGQIGRVISTADANTFVVDIVFQAGTYLGGGVYTRLSQPLIQTKQFPVYWNEGRKVRLGPQRYLLDRTTAAQASLFIFLSQDPDEAWNNTPIVPSDQSTNNSLVYSTILYTCPESTNIGLTAFTQSLNNPDPIAGGQFQIWHRVNTSLIGDTFQIGITLNDTQMRNLTYAIEEITLHAIQADVSPGPYLA